MVYEMCRRFADEELAPNAGQWDKDHSFPQAAVAQLVSTSARTRTRTRTAAINHDSMPFLIVSQFSSGTLLFSICSHNDTIQYISYAVGGARSHGY